MSSFHIKQPQVSSTHPGVCRTNNLQTEYACACGVFKHLPRIKISQECTQICKLALSHTIVHIGQYILHSPGIRKFTYASASASASAYYCLTVWDWSYGYTYNEQWAQPWTLKMNKFSSYIIWNLWSITSMHALNPATSSFFFQWVDTLAPWWWLFGNTRAKIHALSRAKHP